MTNPPLLFDPPLARSLAMKSELELLLQCVAERYKLLLHKQEEDRAKLTAQHVLEREQFKADITPMSAASDQAIEPLPPAVEAVREFPDERYRYPGGQLFTIRGQGPRPRRWRGDDVEYCYPRGHINMNLLPELGTRDLRKKYIRWFTVDELILLRQVGEGGEGEE